MAAWALNVFNCKGKCGRVMPMDFTGIIDEKHVGREKIIDNKRFTCYYNVCKIRVSHVKIHATGLAPVPHQAGKLTGQ
jgi:hypothetical protein